MKHLKHFAVLAVALCVCACSYSVGDKSEGVSVTLSPADGTTDQLVDVAITAEFGDLIEEPPSWYDVFSLKKEGAGDNLCTDITYNKDTRIATCLHDDLETDTDYSIRLSGVIEVNGEIVIFRTAQ